MTDTKHDTSLLHPTDEGGESSTESSLPVKSADSAVKRSDQPGPLTPDFTRAKILEAAGVTIEELGQLARDVITKSRALMDAKKMRYWAHEGRVMDEKEVEDNQTQLGASKQAGEIAGLFSSRASSGSSGKLEVVINLPGWAVIKER